MQMFNLNFWEGPHQVIHWCEGQAKENEMSPWKANRFGKQWKGQGKWSSEWGQNASKGGKEDSKQRIKYGSLRFHGGVIQNDGKI